MALINTGLDDEIAQYVERFAEEPVSALAEVSLEIERVGDEHIEINRIQGQFLSVMALAAGARQVLEIGTFFGYSMLWLAHAVGDDGHVDTIEIEPARAERARHWAESAGFGDRVTVHVGAAQEVLAGMPDDHYDFCFIDADKAGYPAYLEAAHRCVRVGGVIVADNTLHKRRVLEASPIKPQTRSIQAYNERAATHPTLRTVLVPLGDGLTVSVKLDSGVVRP